MENWLDHRPLKAFFAWSCTAVYARTACSRSGGSTRANPSLSISAATSACSDEEHRASRFPSSSRSTLQETHFPSVTLTSHAAATAPHGQRWRPRFADWSGRQESTQIESVDDAGFDVAKCRRVDYLDAHGRELRRSVWRVNAGGVGVRREPVYAGERQGDDRDGAEAGHSSSPPRASLMGCASIRVISSSVV